MDKKGLDFKHKEVISINSGKRLGFVQDVTADFKTGTITSIIVPGNTKLFNLFFSGNEIIIPWEDIKVIGDDIILVNY
jgi:YlmC/YmxH family sporulation protein